MSSHAVSIPCSKLTLFFFPILFLAWINLRGHWLWFGYGRPVICVAQCTMEVRPVEAQTSRKLVFLSLLLFDCNSILRIP